MAKSHIKLSKLHGSNLVACHVLKHVVTEVVNVRSIDAKFDILE